MANFIFVIINIISMIIGYLIINYLLKKKYINQEILNNIKNEISDVIRQMNDITVKNIDLVRNSRETINNIVNEKEKQVTQMLLNIEKKIRTIDEKMKQIKSATPEQWLQSTQQPPKEIQQKNTTYSYIDIINKAHSTIKEKNQIENESQKKQQELQVILSKMDVTDQVGYLSEQGKSHAEIKKLLNLSDGEIELSLNLYKTRLQ